ncbi:hypothetical protein ACFLWY_03060 [Chloroflexota bacterium]
MRGIKFYLPLLMLGLASVLAMGCSSAPSQQARLASLEESQQIAEDLVRHSPTFAYDGMEETLRLADTQTARCPSCWVFTFEFDSRHTGYGDRSGQAVGQAITRHRAVITVEQGAVTSAVMDGRWDMVVQKLL